MNEDVGPQAVETQHRPATPDHGPDGWLGWKAIVSVTVIPAVCGFVFLAARTTLEIKLSLDAVFPGLCTLAAAALAARYITYQVRQTFLNDQELRRLDQQQAVRRTVNSLRDAIEEKRAELFTVIHMVQTYRRELKRLEPALYGVAANTDRLRFHREPFVQYGNIFFVQQLDVFCNRLRLILSEVDGRRSLKEVEDYFKELISESRELREDLSNYFSPTSNSGTESDDGHGSDL